MANKVADNLLSLPLNQRYLGELAQYPHPSRSRSGYRGYRIKPRYRLFRRRGICYDNAAVESFWSTLKLELIYRHQFATHVQVWAAVLDYIEAFHNRQHAHSAPGYLAPIAPIAPIAF